MKISEVNSFIKLRTLLSVDGLGIMSILKLVEILGSIDNLFTFEVGSSQSKDGISSKLLQKLQLAQKKYDTIFSLYEKEIEQIEKIGGKIITYWDNQYPKHLKNIYNLFLF